MLSSPAPWRSAAAMGGAAAIVLAGCAAPLPTYQGLSDEESCRVIAQRLELVRTVSGTGRITLTDAAGESVRLEGALAAAPPDRLRLRAWTFGRAVLDITSVGGETWVLAPDGAEAGDPPEIPRDGLARVLRLLGPEFFRSAKAEERAGTDETLVLTDPEGPGGPVTCEVERGTLTPRRFRAGTDGVLVLDRYRVIDGIAWPMEWRLERGRARVTVRLDSVEINGTLPESAFVPPRRAARLTETAP